MTEPDVDSILDWLIDGARSAAQSTDVLQELCERLQACGFAMWRVAVYVRTLHPLVMGRRFTWRAGAPVEMITAPYGLLDTAEFRDSPIKQLLDTGRQLRRRLADPGCPDDFPVLAEFRAEGITDYVLSPLRFTNGALHVASWTTKAPGGFSDREMAGLARIAPALARVAEVRALDRDRTVLLSTYVGSHAGERIVAGKIRRGDTEAINAVIWMSDMRGFTRLSDSIAPKAMIDLLNRYFDCQLPAIDAQGGQVLKFMGDGLLAIFPIAGDVAAVCAAALIAAREAREQVAALSRNHGLDGVDEVRFGLALHLGEVLYGNVGGETRLDFTCIGPAVNLAARLEKLTSKLGRILLASDAFARHCPGSFAPLGEFALAGFAAPQMAYGLAEEGA